MAPFYSVSDLREGPDLVAFTPGGDVLVGECTTEHVNVKGKLSKLERRATAIKSALQATGAGFRISVQAVVFTALPRGEVVEEHFQDAASMRIAVVCKEDLQHLLDAAPSYPDAPRVLERIRHAIPVKHTESFALRNF